MTELADTNATFHASDAAAESPPTIICLSHLRWDFVWQRPQQLLSRFARTRRVYFIEEPIFESSSARSSDGASFRLNREPIGVPPSTNLTGVVTAQPICRDPGAGGGLVLDEMYAHLLKELVRSENIERYILWFYTPMLLPAVRDLCPEAVVYDAMDELSLFRFAPPELVSRELELLARAQVVFAGGRSLGEAKSRMHPRVFTHPSGVEIEHFRKALDPATSVPVDLQAISGPRVGYFGVIDERMDLELLDQVSDLRPDVSWVMIGPVLKIEETDLPRKANIHYLGSKKYAELPNYVRGLDVCMMPFALNDATKFISPTKTLEYMAAHRIIVSTPVIDVVKSYGDVVSIGATAAEFAALVDLALAENETDRLGRIGREQKVLERNTWDAIARTMDDELRSVCPEPVGVR
ncbi:MAG: glycosyltransferase [Chloroflexi bacterium]|nr:glycosyltransferase [Chloroflexota bacterium]